jgi:hypothetical protein
VLKKRCRDRLGEEALSTASWAECITAESKEVYRSLGIDAALVSNFDDASEEAKEIYRSLKDKGKEYYEGGKRILKEWMPGNGNDDETAPSDQ